MKEINLYDILHPYVINSMSIDGIDIDSCLLAMREACNQAIDACAESAKIVNENKYGEAITIECTIPFEAYGKSYIDKQSILTVKQQIK